MIRISVVAFVAGVFALAALGDEAGKQPPDSRWEGLEKSFEIAKMTRDLGDVKRELLRFFSSPDPNIKALGLRWIGYRRADLTAADQDEFDNLFVQANPHDSYSVRVSMAYRHLDNASLQERTQVYFVAVDRGSVMLEGVAELSRVGALERAGAEGVEEFKLYVDRYADEINRNNRQLDYRRSDQVMWDLVLRAGAKDRADAIALHAKRLVEMDDRRFRALMNGDPAFQAATRSAVVTGCEKQLSEPCLDSARVVMRQDRLDQADAELTANPGAKKVRSVKPSWLEGLRPITAAARVRVRQDSESEAAQQHPNTH